jgi:predicted transcriptional regulator
LRIQADRPPALQDLLFSLASEDRLALLAEISARRQRLTLLSKFIDASPQECSRHLARLADSGFIRKDSDGSYSTTSLGKAVLALFPSLEFLLKYKDYFMSHDLTFLPRGFMVRAGELSEGEFVGHFSQVLELIKKVISTGREYVWLISDQPMVVGQTIGPSFVSRDVPVRLIAEPSIDRKIVAETRLALKRSELRVLPRVSIAMAINESRAGICFPRVDGEIDFGGGFSGSDPQFRGWCSDLYEHYWSKSEKLALD